MSENIYTVSCLVDIPPFFLKFESKEERVEKQKQYNSYGGQRCFGWFPTKNRAVTAVLNNCCDIHERSYKYAIVEKVGSGIHGSIGRSDEEWFEWNDQLGRFYPTDKPKELKGAFGWSLSCSDPVTAPADRKDVLDDINDLVTANKESATVREAMECIELCPFWDSAWCYNPKLKESGCIGLAECQIKHYDFWASYVLEQRDLRGVSDSVNDTKD